MFTRPMLKILLQGSIAVLMSTAGPLIYAHDEIRGGIVKEGYSSEGAIVIAHVCDPTVDAAGNYVYPKIIAHSIVFPNVNPVLARTGGGELSTPDLNGNGSVDMDDIAYNYGPNLVTPYWDNRIFKDHQLKHDSISEGNITGFSSTGGAMQQYFNGEAPIRLNPIYFQESSCVSELVVKPAGVDICKISPKPVNGDIDLWIEHPTPKFPDGSIHGVGENEMRVIYQRDLSNNPVPDSCGGGGFSVTVTASDEDIDANLPIPGYWPGEPKKAHANERRKDRSDL